MKIALPVQNGFINEHFGHSENFTVYTISPEKNIESITPVVSDGCGCHSGIAQILADQLAQKVPRPCCIATAIP